MNVLMNHILKKDKIGKYISDKRKEYNLTQQDLADKLFVSDRAVSKWERGLSIPDIETLINLSKILNVSIIDILNGQDDIIKDAQKTDKEIKKYLKEIDKINIHKIIFITILFIYLAGVFICYLLSGTIIKIDLVRYLMALYNTFNIVPFWGLIECILYGPNKLLFNSIIKNIIINTIITIPIELLIIKISNNKKQYKIISIVIHSSMELIKWITLLGIFDIDDLIVRLMVSYIIMKLYNRR